MCSILAILDGKSDPEALRSRALRLSRLQRHRGPDWSGVYNHGGTVLAHERLSIVDVLHGAQPLLDTAGTCALAVNGEIYNHKELEASLREAYTFRTASDCEVILPLYREKDLGFLDDLNGIFAFVLYDAVQERWVVARDHMGIVPLYMGRDGEGKAVPRRWERARRDRARWRRRRGRDIYFFGRGRDCLRGDSPHDQMATSELLAKVTLFKGLPPADLVRLAAATEPEWFEPGHTIVEVGDPGRSLYVIVEGTVQVVYPARTADIELARMGPGDFFGEMALLNDKPRSATVRAQTSVRALKLERETFRRLLLDAPRVGIRILETLSFRIRAADEQISGLSDQTQRDPLTQLLNRRAFHERLAEECDRFRRHGHPFTVILADLDGFRDINDTFGYETGDAVLAWVGRIVTEHTRASDVAFRIGGEEFAVLCPCVTTDEARNVAQRLVELVSEARPPVSFDLKLSLSAGMAGCPETARRLEDLYRAADQALARAKENGRSRVCAAEEVGV